MKLLILEDDRFIRDEIETYFKMKGHEVSGYENADELFDDMNLENYDILLLDINLPGFNGFDTLKELRKFNINTPVIFITSMSEIDYVKEAYSLGCNDYIRKPFYFEELELRINKLLLKNSSSNIIVLNNTYKFDITKLELIDNEDNEIELSKNEKNLIFLLIKNAPHIVSYDTIIEYVWQAKPINSNTLRTQIKKLRAKLKHNFIINIRGSGYKIEKYD